MGSEGSKADRSRAHRSSRAGVVRRSGRRAMAFPHMLISSAGRRPSPTGAAIRTTNSDESHLVARAWRMREVHARSSSHVCGLCLTAWPCAQRTWAERTLREAHLDAAG